MFKKLNEKAGQPLTHGWLWKIGAIDVIAVGVIYGGMWIYGRYLEQKYNEAEAAKTVDYNEFENEED